MLSKEVSSIIFCVFAMTQSGIEPQSLGPLANTVTIQKFCNILVHALILWHIYHMTKAVQTVETSIMVVGVLTHYNLLHSTCDLKAAQVNVHHSLILKLILNKFKLGHNTVKDIKNIWCVKGEPEIHHSTKIRRCKKFCSSCNVLDNQARSGKSKIMNSKADMFSSTWRVSSDLGISPSSVVFHIHNLSKSIQNLFYIIFNNEN